MTVQIIIDNRIRVRCKGVIGHELSDAVIAELKEVFEHSNPEFYKKERLHFSTYGTPRKIKVWDQDTRWNEFWLSFPRGGLQRIRDILDKHEIDRDLIDERQSGVSIDSFDHFVKLWDYQTRLKDVALDREQCILKAPTGSGKTTCALAIAACVQTPTLVIVSTRALFDQWVKRVEKELGINKKKIGIIQGKKCKLQPITIAMQKTLAERGVAKEIANYFGCVICDEVHLFAAKSFIDAVDPFPAKYRIGISADHTRKDRKEFLIYDLFGAVGAEIKRADLIKSGHVLDVEVRIIPSDFEAPWYGIPEEKDEDFEDLGTDPNDDAKVEEEKSINFDRLLVEMGDDPSRNALVVQAIKYEIDHEQILVMSHRREHCRLLDQFLVRERYKTGFLIGGEDYRREFVKTREAFEEGEVQAAVGTFQAIGYGIDLPKASVVVCSTPIANNKQFFNQVRGRVCRTSKGKKGARMYYIWDRSIYGVKHLKNLLRWNGEKQTKILDHAGKWIDVKTYIRSLKNAA